VHTLAIGKYSDLLRKKKVYARLTGHQMSLTTDNAGILISCQLIVNIYEIREWGAAVWWKGKEPLFSGG